MSCRNLGEVCSTVDYDRSLNVVISEFVCDESHNNSI